MVNIRIERVDSEIKSITISGHANSDRIGHDLVCAEMSAIGVGTLNAIDEMCPDSCLVEMKKGYINIQVNRSSDRLQTILNMLEIQLLTVEYTNKDYVTVRKVEV